MEQIVVTDRIRSMTENLAHMSDHHMRVGAIIVKGRRIIAGGFNKSKTHTVIRNKIDKFSLVDKLHAEMNAILKARTDLEGAKMYVLRVCINNKHLPRRLTGRPRGRNLGDTGMSRPCNLCMNLIRNSGIKEIIYTTGNPLEPWVKERIYD